MHRISSALGYILDVTFDTHSYLVSELLLLVLSMYVQGCGLTHWYIATSIMTVL